MLICDVLKGKKTDRTPIWIMRQAGRYMPEYRRLREKYSFLQMCLTPEIAAEITMQPIKAFGMDAAIIFSDILIPALSMGMDLKFVEGKGPVFSNSISTKKDVEKITANVSNEHIEKVVKAIKMVRNELPAGIALIGFCGGPLTTASYMIEGGKSKNFYSLKTMIYNNPSIYHSLMEKITTVLIEYLNAQAKAGANVLQIFDTWGGILTQKDFELFSLPYIKKLIAAIKKQSKVPVIYFMKNNTPFIKCLKTLDVEALGMDWTVNLDEISVCLDNQFILQGNMDPLILTGKKELIKQRAAEILERGKHLKGHIFNMGHGVIPQTPVDNVKFLVDVVKEFKK